MKKKFKLFLKKPGAKWDTFKK